VVDRCTLLDVGGKDGLVGTELSDYIVRTEYSNGNPELKQDGLGGLIRYCNTTCVFVDTQSFRQG
jgi:hypothetical protein